MKPSIIKMFKLQEQIKSLEKECEALGKDAFGYSYEGCYLGEGTLTIHTDVGHEFDWEDTLYDENGEEL